MQLAINDLACRRGGRLVFRRTGFTVEAGGLALVTGENGSGKSSLLRVLAGLVPAESGTILWDGADVAADWRGWQARVNYIGHLDAAKTELTVGEMVGYWGALGYYASSGSRTPSPNALPQGRGLLDVFELNGLHDRAIKLLSAGQRRRLALTRLAMRDAKVWLLDEPVTALDARGQKLFWECVARHRADGGIAVMAAHGVSVDGAVVVRMGQRDE